MTVIVEGKMFGGYQKPDFTNKETGEVAKGKYVIQLMVANMLKNGQIKKELVDISLPPERVKDYEGQDGKTVQVRCDYISKEKVVFYGV
jgi:hypothetical protein